MEKKGGIKCTWHFSNTYVRLFFIGNIRIDIFDSFSNFHIYNVIFLKTISPLTKLNDG